MARLGNQAVTALDGDKLTLPRGHLQ